MFLSKLSNRIGLTACIFFLSLILFGEVTSNKNYSYDSVARLEGTVIKKNSFGPPDFGESPKTDKKITFYILKLFKPINVIGDHNPKSVDQDDFGNVKEIELEIFPSSKISIKKYLNKKVTIKGKLYERDKGWEITDVLMYVETIDLKK